MKAAKIPCMVSGVYIQVQKFVDIIKESAKEKRYTKYNVTFPLQLLFLPELCSLPSPVQTNNKVALSLMTLHLRTPHIRTLHVIITKTTESLSPATGS